MSIEADCQPVYVIHVCSLSGSILLSIRRMPRASFASQILCSIHQKSRTINFSSNQGAGITIPITLEHPRPTVFSGACHSVHGSRIPDNEVGRSCQIIQQGSVIHGVCRCSKASACRYPTFTLVIKTLLLSDFSLHLLPPASFAYLRFCNK